MTLTRLLSLSLTFGLAAASASAQEVQTLVTRDTDNTSASSAVTRSIAAYIAARNNTAAVQELARSPSTKAPAVTVDALLMAIETNSRIVPGEPTPAAAVTPTPSTEQPKKTRVNSGGGGGGGGGAGGGGGGGW